MVVESAELILGEDTAPVESVIPYLPVVPGSLVMKGLLPSVVVPGLNELAAFEGNDDAHHAERGADEALPWRGRRAAPRGEAPRRPAHVRRRTGDAGEDGGGKSSLV